MELQENFEALIQEPAYGVPHEKKAAIYARMLTSCTQYHRRHCAPYGQYLHAIGCPEGSFFYNTARVMDYPPSDGRGPAGGRERQGRLCPIKRPIESGSAYVSDADVAGTLESAYASDVKTPRNAVKKIDVGAFAGQEMREEDIPFLPLCLGRGRIFHLAPANVPMMFAYTWIIGLLAGNAGIVRISERTLASPSVQAVLDVLRTLFAKKDWQDIRERTSFISYPHSDSLTEEILKGCDGRVLWGGDETVRRMRAIPMPAHTVELAFPDRVSIAVLCEDALAQMGEEELRRLVHRFYNDTYMMDQNGCSSPQTVVWMRADKNEDPCGSRTEAATGEGIRERWWELLA